MLVYKTNNGNMLFCPWDLKGVFLELFSEMLKFTQNNSTMYIHNILTVAKPNIC